MMAATGWPEFDNGLPGDLLKSATSVSGLFDLEPILSTPVNEDVRMDSAMAARNSPMTLRPAHDMPMTIAVGGAESDEFRRQSREFRDHWAARLGAIGYIETKGDHHFTVVEGQARADNPITRALLGHMGL